MFKTFSMWNVSNILDAGWRVSMEECRWALTRRVPSGEVGDFVIGLLGTREPLARLRCNRAVVQSAWFVAVIGILRLALGFAGSGALSNTLKQCTATKPRWRRRLRSGRFPDGHRLSALFVAKCRGGRFRDSLRRLRGRTSCPAIRLNSLA